MALALAYVNEVLNQLDSTVVVDDATWPELVRLLKFEDREADLAKMVLGRMRLRTAQGGYDGLLAQLDALLAENHALRSQLAERTTAPVAPVETATMAAGPGAGFSEGPVND